jgi:hypothetical protein
MDWAENWWAPANTGVQLFVSIEHHDPKKSRPALLAGRHTDKNQIV